ncbi:phage major capsid protein, P2 family [Aliivibrio salmonicida]|jgi:P2 family phage major capsid protein|uniref:Phage major capsid protein n=1 Tax=Aliivibrio salmonicida (strain LFI1238) TaxID=316275 RepID=B6EH27_ALISL|nr:phage major capsid protein, P2 family [Aliivibrio salmonicida]AZL86148.1 phage major capsid protein, P2 family [Aliivibrio salmonicida]CAQ78456.1 phage major capsid protein [Aliivibrio salmonicida LFI1238]
MQEATKVVLAAYAKAVAKKYGVSDVTEKFSVTPVQTQRIIAQIRESNWFLGKINIISVSNQKGEALGLGVTGMIASRTDTSEGTTRKTKTVFNLKAMPYLCEQINFDTHMRYNQLDAFAHMKNFAIIISMQTREQIDTNKITIGFYGKECAANTDPKANPNGEDVCKGWFQALREHNPAALLVQGKTENEIRIGEGGDFVNLDLAVMNVKGLLHDACENAPDLIAIIGSDLLAYEKAKFYVKHGNTPSEKAKIEEMQIIGTYGGLPAVSVPGFPPSGILVTSYKNLSIYIQEGSIRRAVAKRNDERDQIENFESMNMAYVIEQLEKAAAVEFDNVRLLIDGEWV